MIVITEVQKRVIESQGFMVVDFKLWCKKIQNVITAGIHTLCNMWEAMVVFLQDKMCNAFDSIIQVAQRISEELRPYIYKIRDLDNIQKPKFQLVKKIGQKYRCEYTRVTIYHCRNNC